MDEEKISVKEIVETYDSMKYILINLQDMIRDKDFGEDFRRTYKLRELNEKVIHPLIKSKVIKNSYQHDYYLELELSSLENEIDSNYWSPDDYFLSGCIDKMQTLLWKYEEYEIEW